MYIVWAILAFSILIIIHEFGHFILAKINGVKVEEFSIGMGPKLLGKQGNETMYSLRILPIGGYVKMLGDESESDDPRAFNNKTPGKKLSIVAAGPIMNLILAIVLFAIINGIVGYPVPIIKETIPDSPAILAGLESGDKIIKIDDKDINKWEDLQSKINESTGKPLEITFIRNNKINTVKITPMQDNGRFMIGVAPIMKKPTVFKAIGQGFITTNTLIKEIFKFFKVLFTGNASASDFGGPISIIKISGAVAKSGLINLTYFTAILSVQLAIFNIIPFPALDGGYIILYLYEIFTKRHVDDNKVGTLNYIGFILLITIMILVTIKDILYPVNF